MASYKDLQNDWSTLCQECHSSWTQSDLQLAAELGKTLLERNKELENCIKLHQCTIDDQTQEIEYMKKQTAALREVNDSRLKIYEQLEVSIQDLERANQRLALENTNDKKQIKSQCLTIDTLEIRVDELQKKFDELKADHEGLFRKQIKDESSIKIVPNRTASSHDGSTHQMAVSPRKIDPENNTSIQQLGMLVTNVEDITKLQQQLQESRFQCTLELRKIGELEEQRDTLLQENAQLEEQLNDWKAKAQHMKNLQDEINTLEEVRQGHLCGRCLRSTNTRIHDNLSLMLDQEEDDEVSLAESLASSMPDPDSTLQELNIKAELSEEDNCNPYRVLVEKYEALLKVHQKPGSRCKSKGFPDCMSLQQELQMSSVKSKHESGCSDISISKKHIAITPTDFSEAETSSSGFSDETSNKFTQTDCRLGSFLCSIADGDDCKFSIYDDSSTFESRFHKTPEYRKLFSEIFEVLKRAAVAKDEGMELPLLKDPMANLEQRTICVEDSSIELMDDTKSVVSLAVSSIASEPVIRVHTPLFNSKPKIAFENGLKTWRPVQNSVRCHQPLEYLSLQVKKKSSTKKSIHRSNGSGDTKATPDIIPTAYPRMVQLKGSGRRRFRPLTVTEISDGVVWNGNTAHFYASRSSRGQQQQQQSPPTVHDSGKGRPGLDYRPGTAAEEVAKLRRLEMSYAEVLRMPNKSKGNNNHQRRSHQ